jgi:hypothetical protein
VVDAAADGLLVSDALSRTTLYFRLDDPHSLPRLPTAAHSDAHLREYIAGLRRLWRLDGADAPR